MLILGIIGAIALPRFSNVSASARSSMLADSLRIFRIQVAVFRAQHLGVSAGYPNCDTTQAPTAEAFVAHMTTVSNEAGETAVPGTPGYRYGIYLREIPENPVNGKNSVQIIGDGEEFPTEADDSHGWIYQPSTLVFKTDATGTDEFGKSYFADY